MRNKILRPANSKYHYSYLFFYKINNGDLPSMYSCAFWCEYIDLVGVFWLLLFDHYHFPQVRTPLSDLTLVWDLNSYIDRIEYHFLTGWFFFFFNETRVEFCALHFSRLHSSSSTHEALAYVLPQFDALTHVVIRVSSAIIFQTLAEVCYSVYVNRSSFKSVLNLRKAYIFKSLPKVYYRSVKNEPSKVFIYQKCAESLHPK